MIKKLFVLCFILSSALQPSFAGEKIELYVGKIKILNVGDIERIAVGNSTLLSTSMLNNGQLLLIAEKEGDSNVHIWFKDGTEKDYTVHITKSLSTAEKTANEVRNLLADVEGLNIRVVGERVVLSGLVDSGHTSAITTVMEAIPGLMDLTQKAVLNDDAPDNKMVIMNIKITEFNKNYLENFGINWDSAIAGPAAALALDGVTNSTFRVTPEKPVSFNGALNFNDQATPLPRLINQANNGAFGYFGIAAEITSRINFAVNSGNAVILAEPRLSTRSGGEASFLAGGEFPIEISTISGTTIEFKEFGVALSVKPVVDRNDNIRANVSTEISAIDRSVSVGDVPGLLTRKTATDISMRSGETLVMSGLMNQQASKDTSGVKFLMDIPILGHLFRSKNFRDQKSELVIFVTPKIFNADSDINKEAIDYAKKGVEATVEQIDEKRLDIVY
ncbi:MAG: type II and III secretion system protein [Gammaproteobacteria bacterium]|jgi:pilus assembly protein CpaC|nr:type II and III secretion system protein [Gammaproteobacteria bacterium]